jgi:hypothetical protein
MLEIFGRLFGMAGDLQRYALIRDGDVIDVVMIDLQLPAEQKWTPPPGCEIVQSDEAGVGWRYENGRLFDPAPPPPPFVRGVPDVD